VAAGSTYTPIATANPAGGTTASINFSSFSGYTDLVLVFFGRVNANSGDVKIRFNSDANTSYSSTWYGAQPPNYSGRNSNLDAITATEYSYLDSTRDTLSIINIFNYSTNGVYKSILTRSNKTGYGVEAKVGLWRNTSPITSIDVFATGALYFEGVYLTLYGIAAA
jgi:hypothetical protein